jgi:CheY-like chemotaxis protein
VEDWRRGNELTGKLFDAGTDLHRLVHEGGLSDVARDAKLHDIIAIDEQFSQREETFSGHLVVAARMAKHMVVLGLGISGLLLWTIGVAFAWRTFRRGLENGPRARGVIAPVWTGALGEGAAARPANAPSPPGPGSRPITPARPAQRPVTETVRPAAEANAAPSPGPPALPCFGARILVADDNTVNQEVVGGFLENLGCHMVAARNGRMAVWMFAQETFDLVLMDCQMPVIDGLEASRRIRRIEMRSAPLPGQPPRQRTPIIALTANAMADVEDSCLRAGMDDFLIKPFTLDQIVTTLGRWLTPATESAATPPEPAPVAVTPETGNAEQTNAPLETAAIDDTVIQSLFALDPKKGTARLQRAVTQFRTIAPPLAATMRKAILDRNADALWHAAHSLKSSSGALGALQVAKSCGEIEQAARKAGTDAARPLVESLDSQLSAAILGLEKTLDGVVHGHDPS